MKYLSIPGICLAVLLAGCEQRDPPKSDGIDIKWPGGEFKYDAENGVSVEAPNVKVDVKPGRGVDVDAGDVKVNHESGRGVDVTIPESRERTDL